jgi:DNA invertase Pin-like site-specific DNA recombinase
VDRLGRSLLDLISGLQDLHAARVDLFLHQQALDTTTPAGKAMFGMMGVFTEFEQTAIHNRIRESATRRVADPALAGRSLSKEGHEWYFYRDCSLPGLADRIFHFGQL